LDSALNSSPQYIRSATVVSRLIAGETLVVPIRGGVGDLASIYTFNETGTVIWEALAEPRTVSDLRHAVEREFEVSSNIAEADVTAFLAEVHAAGLVSLSERMSETQPPAPEEEIAMASPGDECMSRGASARSL
jgi:hypothetical protein